MEMKSNSLQIEELNAKAKLEAGKYLRKRLAEYIAANKIGPSKHVPLVSAKEAETL